MSMDQIIFAGVFFVLFLLLVLNGKTQEKKRKETMKIFFRESYGKENQRTWKAEELEQASHYSRMRKQESFLDDLTWKDLDMDQVYKGIAYTQSSLGDDYLYYLLRNPAEEESVLLERERKLCCLKEQEELRVQLQILYAKMGRVQQFSFSDYIRYLMKENPKSNGRHYLAICLIFLSLLGMRYHAGAGLCSFFLLILYNIVTYFKEKAYLDPYLKSLRYLFLNLDCGKEILKLLPKEWEKEKAQLGEILDAMKKVQKHSFLVMSPGRMAGEGLELILDYLRMCLHLDIIKFNRMLSELKKQEAKIWMLYEILGELDACIAIDCYRSFLKQFCVPEFWKEKKLQTEEMYHPLVKNAVPNSFAMKQNILLTGANASGKSTFLKTIGINVLLAQSIHTCAAKSFELPFCRLYTSLSLKDSLRLKESYYMAEIKAVKRILDAAQKDRYVVCLIDEVLRGTNTMERIAASTQILKEMDRQGILCVAATHDAELTKTLEKEYVNYHFEKSLMQGDIRFSYKLKKGREEGCNAIDLLAELGYNETLVKNAREMVEIFKERGEWICG